MNWINSFSSIVEIYDETLNDGITDTKSIHANLNFWKAVTNNESIKDALKIVNSVKTQIKKTMPDKGFISIHSSKIYEVE